MRIQKLLSEEVRFAFDKVFLVDETTLCRQSSASQRNACFGWRADDGLTLKAGLVALWLFRGSGPTLLRNPIFGDFMGWGRLDPIPPSLWIRSYIYLYNTFSITSDFSGSCKSIWPKKEVAFHQFLLNAFLGQWPK